jgi:hypothetical protein
LCAASVPSGTESSTASVIVTSAIESVGSRRWARSCVTGTLGEDRGAEIAGEDAAEPADELDRQRLVEAEHLAQPVDVVGGREVAGDQRRGVPRREVDQEEDDHRHHRHHRQRGGEPPEHVVHGRPSAALPLFTCRGTR